LASRPRQSGFPQMNARSQDVHYDIIAHAFEQQFRVVSDFSFLLCSTEGSDKSLHCGKSANEIVRDKIGAESHLLCTRSSRTSTPNVTESGEEAGARRRISAWIDGQEGKTVHDLLTMRILISSSTDAIVVLSEISHACLLLNLTSGPHFFS
jgi:hypothetical protein